MVMGPGVRRDDTGYAARGYFRISKYPLDNSVNRNYLSHQPVPPKGRFAIVTERGAGCDGRCGVRWLRLPDENAAAYGEIVWFWRRDPGVKLLVRPMQ